MTRVFAGMSDGLVAVYNLQEDVPVEGEAYLCSHTLNKTVFGLKDSDSRQKPYPVKSMALVSSGSQVCVTSLRRQQCLYIMDNVNSCVWQLWFSNGPGVLIINSRSLQPIRRLEPYSPPSSIISMTTSFCLWGEEAVWMLDDYSNTLLLYHAASYQICAHYWWVELHVAQQWCSWSHQPTSLPKCREDLFLSTASVQGFQDEQEVAGTWQLWEGLLI